MDEYKRLLKQIHLTYSNELYVVDYKGHLVRLQCPFVVMATETIGEVKQGLKYNVSSVKITVRLETVYQIANSYYLYKLFEIL